MPHKKVWHLPPLAFQLGITECQPAWKRKRIDEEEERKEKLVFKRSLYEGRRNMKYVSIICSATTCLPDMTFRLLLWMTW